MSALHSRHNLSGKERKRLLTEVERLYPDLVDEVRSAEALEVVKTRMGFELYLTDGNALFFRLKSDERLYPTLIALLLHKGEVIPSVTVDEGAIPHIKRGADVMRPGIVKVEGKFGEGDVVAVKECKYGKPIALGTALASSEDLAKMKRGRVIKNLHHLEDDIWDVALKVSRLFRSE